MIASTLRALVNAVRTAAHASPETSVKKRIANAAAAIGTLSVVVKGASLASTLVIASFFGTGDALEAYLIAFLAPSVLITVVSRSFRSATVPTYVQVLEQQGPDEAQRLFSTITFLAIALLALVAALFAISSSYLLPLIGSGFNAEKLGLTQRLAYLLVPAIVLKGIATIYASVLNARERFSLAAFAPILVPVSTVLATLAWQVPATRIYAVAIGTVVGMLGETAVVAWGLKRQRVVLRPRWPRSTAASRQVIAQYFPMVAAALLMSGTTFVDQAMAASLPAGSVASLSYGGRVVNVALHLVTGAIGVAVLPFFSKMVDAGNWNELRSVLRVYTTWLLVLMIATGALLAVFSESIIGLALERGMFSEADTVLVGRIQTVYALQMPFYVCGILFVRVISAMKANQILTIGSLSNLIVNVVLNYVFMQRWGVVGIALSTVFVYLLSCVYLMSMAYRRLPRKSR